MNKNINDTLDKFLDKFLYKEKHTKNTTKTDITVKDGLYERIDGKTFLIEDGRQLLND